MKDILKSSILIARFMGAKFDKETFFAISPNDLWLHYHGIVNYTTINHGHGPILKYHTSWDWLLPVFKSITDLAISYDEDGYDLIEICADAITDVSITGAFEAIVEFIEWYNEREE